MPRSLVSRAVIALLATVATLVAACGSPAGSPQTSPAASTAAPASPTASPTPSASSAVAKPSPTLKPGTATPPAGWPTPAILVPPSPLPSPPGAALPADLIGREYVTAPMHVQGIQAEVMTLRAADDPHCAALYRGTSTCFTILWTPNYPKHVDDPAVRGPARIVNGKLVLGWALVPSDQNCEGTSSSYSISADGWTLDGFNVSECGDARYVRY
jgi:hypothetical protein